MFLFIFFTFGALAGPAIAGLSSLFGAGGPSAEEKNLMRQSAETSRVGRAVGQSLLPTGQRYTQSAEQSLAPVDRYYRNLLGTSRGRMTDILQPEIGAITDAYRSARESEATLRPRGGGRATLLSGLPYQQARDISTLFQSVRPQAAQGLLQTSQAYGNLGTSTLQNAINALYQSAASGRDSLEAQNAIRQREYEQSRDLGRSLFDIGQGIYGGFGGGGGGKAGGGAGGGTKIGASGGTSKGSIFQ